MNSSNLAKNLKRLVGQRNIFLCLTIILAVTTASQGFLLMGQKQRIIIVPTNGPEFWLEESSVSSSYIEQMGVYIASLLLNRTPADVAYKNRMLLKHVHPSAYHVIRKALAQDQVRIIKQNQAYTFRSERNFVDSSSLSFTTEGDRLVLIGKANQPPTCVEQEKMKYTFQFQVQNGRLLLTSLTKESP